VKNSILCLAIFATMAVAKAPAMAQTIEGQEPSSDAVPYSAPAPQTTEVPPDDGGSASTQASANASASATTSTVPCGAGEPVKVRVMERVVEKPVYITKTIVRQGRTRVIRVCAPRTRTSTIRLTRMVNGRTRVVHLYRPVDSIQAKTAAIAALRQLNVVDEKQLNTALAHLANDKIFRSLYRDWGIASKSFVDARIKTAIVPLKVRVGNLEEAVYRPTPEEPATPVTNPVVVMDNEEKKMAMLIFGGLAVVIVGLVIIAGFFSSKATATASSSSHVAENFTPPAESFLGEVLAKTAGDRVASIVATPGFVRATFSATPEELGVAGKALEISAGTAGVTLPGGTRIDRNASFWAPPAAPLLATSDPGKNGTPGGGIVIVNNNSAKSFPNPPAGDDLEVVDLPEKNQKPPLIGVAAGAKPA
jgi:hypothetical protein